MQKASREYISSMKEPMRNRGYIKVTIGVVNNAAMSTATVLGVLDKMSNVDATLSGDPVAKPYAVTDQDFTKVDGSMYFAPTTGNGSYNQGLVAQAYPGVIWIAFGGTFDIKGLTLDFGEYYPTQFTVKTNLGTETYTNDSPLFVTEDVFNGIGFIEIRPVTMKYGYGRLRINGFITGVADTFSNDKVLHCTRKEYVSPITESVPSIDASVTVDNQDLYFSVDNPDSALAYMEVGQELKIQYGYDVTGNGDIEWLKPRKMYLSDWSANDTEATFSGTDRFTQLGETYYGGRYYSSGRTALLLAQDVLQDAGLTADDWSLDPHLASVTLKNPIPPCTHAEALQMIANACRAVLFTDTDNRIAIKTTFEPTMTITSEDEAAWSDVSNIANTDPKDAYAMTSHDFTTVTGTMFFPGNPDSKSVGYISGTLASGGYELYIDAYGHLIWRDDDEDSGCDFDTVNGELIVTADDADNFSINARGHVIRENIEAGTGPIIKITLDTYCNAYGVGIKFREQHPGLVCIRTYNQNTLLDDVTYDVDALDFQTSDTFYDFDYMEIEFLDGYPYGAVTVDSIWFGNATDYTLTRAYDLTGSPTGARQQKVKRIRVQRTIYKLSSSTTTITTEEIEQNELTDNQYTVYFSAPTTNLAVSVSSGASSASIVASSNYYATIEFTNVTGTIDCTVTGKEYIATEKYYSKAYNSNGSEIVWKNPLIHTSAIAQDVEEWIATYYLGDVEYEIPWRGDPRTEASDMFWLQLKERDDVLIQSYEDTLDFNGAWSGTLKARKKVL